MGSLFFPLGDFIMLQFIEKNVSGKLNIKIVSEEATSIDPARVIVLCDGKLIGEIVGKVERKQARDGNFYHCVTLEKIE